MEHENEHLDIREKLLRLPKVQADDNFLKRLQIQIDILDSEDKTRDVVDKGSVSGYFKNLFGSRLMPALGISSVVVAAFLVYFILADKKDAVVNNMTGNNNTETIITTEKPGTTNTAPVTENKDLAKTEDKVSENKTSENNLQQNTDLDSRDRTHNKRENSYGVSSNETDKISQPLFSEEKIVTPSSDVKSNTSVDVEQNGKIGMPPQGGITAKKSDDKTKDSELKSSMPPTSSNEQEKTQEKTINEGGRGNTDSKSPKANIKPKKKDVNGVIKINKSVLETLRDKLK